MRALLVNPWIYDFAAYDLWSKPLGLLNIASRLKKLGFKISLIDCLDRLNPSLARLLKEKLPKSSPYGCGNYYSEIVDKPGIYQGIKRYYKRYGYPPELFDKLLNETPKPDIIFVTSGMTYWYPGVIEAIRVVKNKFPNAPLVLGGVYATLCHEHAQKLSNADVVYKGGDIKEILKLTQTLLKIDFDIDKATRDPLIPLYELYPKLSYITLKTSTGCPFRCSYCGWYLLDKGFSQQNYEFVIDEIEYFSKSLKVVNFAFYDDALLYNAENHIIKILEGIIRKKIKVNFFTPNGLHARFMTKNLAILMKKANFINPRLALETSNAERQQNTGFKVSNDVFLNSVKFLLDAGYESKDIGVNLLLGLPGETFESMKGSIEFVSDLRLRIYPEEYSPIPGTEYYRLAGFDKTEDPLKHNNSIFPMYKRDDAVIFDKVKELIHNLNSLLRK